MKGAFVYIWEYSVDDDCIVSFKKIYGPDGDWVKLFRRAEGYVRTDLLSDQNNPNRFITIDVWKSKAHRDNFRREYSEEFEKLDQYAESYTRSEKPLGEFDALGDDSA